MKRRRVLVGVLVCLASVAITLALVAGYTRRVVVNSDQFANRAAVALRSDAVRTLLAERITDQVILKRHSALTAVRPLVESIVGQAIGGRAFSSLFRAAVQDGHSALFHRDADTITLTVADLGTVLAAALDVARPDLARQVRSIGPITVTKRDVGSVAATAVRLDRSITVLAVVLVMLAVLLAGGALVLSRDRRATVMQLGIGVAVGGAAIVVVLAFARSVVVGQVTDPDVRAATGAVWDAYLADLRVAAWIIGGCGAVIAACAASLIRPIEVDEPLRRAWRRIVTEPAHRGWKVVRAAVLVAVGLLCIFDRDAVLALLLTAAGGYLVFAGVSAILRLVYQPREPDEERAAAKRGRAWVVKRFRGAAVVILVGAAAIAATLVVFADSDVATTPSPPRGPCNGFAALCSRPLDDVALAATHNAMSVPLPGWFASEQDAPIPDQLDDGVRGLLIDTHYADRLSNGSLRTEFGPDAKVKTVTAQDGVSQSAIDAALRIRDRAGFAGQGTRGMYLCHTFCELGGTPLATVLTQIDDFLVANPDQVLVVINQDYVTPQDFVAAVDRAGLGKLAYRGPTTGTWPTLQQLIDRDQRVVFLAENHAGGARWYHPAYRSILEDTPYTFRTTAQLTDRANRANTCRANRGPAGAPLFLVNHWISTDPVPLPANAATVNAREPLLARLRECEKLRHHMVNLVAVNFYRRGDVFRVVNELNGVG